MAQNEYINKILFVNQTIADLTSVTVDESTLLQGYTAHSADGKPIIGTLSDETLVDRLVITNNPDVMTYHKYQSVDYTGIEVTAYTPDGFEKIVTDDCTFIPAQKSILEGSGTIPLIVRYKGKSVTLNVTVDNTEYIPTWENGTIEEIEYALERHYNDDIDLTEYWNVGDERVVNLSQIANVNNMGIQPEQTITMVIMNKGGKELVTPINDHTECAFVVGQKNTLVNTGMLEQANYNDSVWNRVARRTWLNEQYRNAIPESIRQLFKLHINSTGQYSTFNVPIYTEDYFAYTAEKEVFGTNTQSNADGEVNLSQFDYYKTASNRIKINPSTEVAINWGLRSVLNGSRTAICIVNPSGEIALTSNCKQANGIAPFGVI